MKIFIAFMLIFLAPQIMASNHTEKEMASGETLSITKFDGNGETLIFWIPSERGYRKGSYPVTMELSDLGIDVHVVDIHSSYMLQTGNRSFEDFENDDLLELLQNYKDEGFKNIYMMSSGRGAVVSLQLARDWQLKHPRQTLLKGFVFTHPHFIQGRPEIGSEANYVDIAKLSNLPVYLFQPEYSTKYARSMEIANTLKSGGSAVFIHPLKEVHGGYYMRSEDDMTEVDLQAKASLAGYVESALNVLASVPKATHAVFEQEQKQMQEVKKTSSFRSAQLYPFKGDPTPPNTQLKTFDGADFDLASLKGEVVLVNFWATWCGPCIEEIPSLNRLLARFKDKPFKVVAINIGEPKKEIELFLKQLKKTGVSLDFPVLLDEKGASVRDWKVYAYPSNYLIDASGKIRYAYRGALKWDAEHIVESIDELF